MIEQTFDVELNDPIVLPASPPHDIQRIVC